MTDSPPAEKSNIKLSVGGAIPAAWWTFAFLVLRLLAVSEYNWDTAFAISTTMSVNDGLALLFGSLLAGNVVVSVFLIWVLPLLIATYAWSPGGRRAVVKLPIAVGLALIVALTISFDRWWLPLAACAVFGLYALMRRMPPESRVRRVTDEAMSRVGWIAAVAALLVAALLPTPWVPRERIETTSGTVYGYVLSVDPGYLNVLNDDHEYVVIRTADVLARDSSASDPGTVG